MTEFEQAFLKRHGEIALVSIVENWERAAGIRHEAPVPFEIRWQNFIQQTTSFSKAA